MITKERKKDIGKMFAEDPDGDWKQGLNHEEQLLVLYWEYQFYYERFQLIEEILENLKKEMGQLISCIDFKKEAYPKIEKEEKKIELYLSKHDYKKIKEEAAIFGFSIEELLETFFADLISEDGNNLIAQWIEKYSAKADEDFLVYLIRKDYLKSIEHALYGVSDKSETLKSIWKKYISENHKEEYDGAYFLEMNRVKLWLEDLQPFETFLSNVDM